MIDKKYTLLSKEVSKTDDLRRKALDTLKKVKADAHETKKALYDAKGMKAFYIHDYEKFLNSRKVDEKVRLALETFEEYSSAQEEIIADLNNQRAAAIAKSKNLKAKVAKVDRKRDFPRWKYLRQEIKELDDLADELYARIGQIRKEIGEEKRRVEAEAFGDDLDFREVRVNLDEAKLEEARLSRMYSEKIQAQKRAVAAYNKACKNHNAAVTELWQHMINKRRANMAM